MNKTKKIYKTPEYLLQDYKPMPVDLFNKLRAENQKRLDELIKKDAKPFECDICGIKPFHSRLAHQWKMMQKIVCDKADCAKCKETILSL